MLISIDLPVADSAGLPSPEALRQPAAEAGAGFTGLLHDFSTARLALRDASPGGRALPAGGKGLPLEAPEPAFDAGAGQSPAEFVVELLAARQAGAPAEPSPVETIALAAPALPGTVEMAALVAREAGATGLVASPVPAALVRDLGTDRPPVGTDRPAAGTARAALAQAAVVALPEAPVVAEAPLAAASWPSVAGRPVPRIAPTADGVALPAATAPEAAPPKPPAAEPALGAEAMAFDRLAPAEPSAPLAVADRIRELTIGRGAGTLPEKQAGAPAAAPLPGAPVAHAPLAGLVAQPGPGLQAAMLPAIATPPQSPAFAEALGERVLFMTGRAIPAAEIRLVPAELGPVTVSLTVEDGRAELSFAAPHPQTRDAIEQALPRLREMLNEQGITLGQASVTDHGAQRDTARAAATEPEASAAAGAAGDDFEPALKPLGRVLRGLIDTFA